MNELVNSLFGPIALLMAFACVGIIVRGYQMGNAAHKRLQQVKKDDVHAEFS